MHNNLFLLGELSTSIITSSAIATAVNTEPLITALITFGVSIITMVGGELIKFLVAYFKKKTSELESKKDTEKENKEE